MSNTKKNIHTLGRSKEIHKTAFCKRKSILFKTIFIMRVDEYSGARHTRSVNVKICTSHYVITLNTSHSSVGHVHRIMASFPALSPNVSKYKQTNHPTYAQFTTSGVSI